MSSSCGTSEALVGVKAVSSVLRELYVPFQSKASKQASSDCPPDKQGATLMKRWRSAGKTGLVYDYNELLVFNLFSGSSHVTHIYVVSI